MACSVIANGCIGNIEQVDYDCDPISFPEICCIYYIKLFKLIQYKLRLVDIDLQITREITLVVCPCVCGI